MKILILLLLAAVSVVSASAQVTDSCDVTAFAQEVPHEEYAATQLPAEVGKPVQWVKQVDVQNLYDQAESQLMVSIPDDAQNVVVIDMSTDAPLDAAVETGVVTITDTLGFNEQKSYLVKFETTPPEQSETSLSRDGESLKKNIIVSSDYHYEDVLTYTDIPELEPSEALDNIQLFWQIDGVRTDVTTDPDLDLQFYDRNGNGLYDQISWVTPHLSTQVFEVVIFSDAAPGNYSYIDISLSAPSDGEYITSNSRVGFNYTVSYNASTTVFCNLTVDTTVLRENIPASSDVQVNDYANLTSGQHAWHVNCAGDDGLSDVSETRTFTLDTDQPSITLNTPDYHVSYTGSIQLNFTPLDTKYPVLVCALSINGAMNQTNIIVNNNTLHTLTLSGLANGVYDWNVSCKDAAGNTGSSEERVFYISQGAPSDYNISPNKGTYSIGEVGYLIIDAKSGTNLTLFVDTPKHDSFFSYFNGVTYPIVEMINYTDNSGTYNIDGIFMNGGDMYVIKTSFDVTNTFFVDIDTNETTGIPGQTFRLEANASGGIGAVTYEWDFDDDTPEANGTEVEHTFGNVGEYNVKVTATDSRNNQVTDVQTINIFRKHYVHITVKELQTKKVLSNVPVEVDDARKYTDDNGEVEFEVYEGKRRIYVAYPGYEWVKQVRNITENLTITIELNNTAITNYTPVDDATTSNVTTEAQKDSMAAAEKLLAKVSAAIEDLASTDEETKAAMSALQIEEGLQSTRKQIRQAIRDLGNLETDQKLTAEEREDKAKKITSMLDALEGQIAGVAVKDATEFVDYPVSSDISMISSEYLKYRGLEYSKRQKETYIKENAKLQEDITITTRLSIVELTFLSGSTAPAALVTNKITKQPVDAGDAALLEYIPKEVAASVNEIEKITPFDVVKSDPILKFDPSASSYSYYIRGTLDLDDLKKTKHILVAEPPTEEGGISSVTGHSILPRIRFENPKMAAQIILILILLVAYVVYHFDLVDRLKERLANGKQDPYKADMAYKPESTLDTVSRKVMSFVRKEDAALMNELSHIKTLIMATYSHSENNNHDQAAQTYKHVMGAYKSLSREAKQHVHPDTQQLFNTMLLKKIEHLINEAFVHIGNNQHHTARSHYSEIKNLYTKLEKAHRASVSERCMRLHAMLFEQAIA